MQWLISETKGDTEMISRETRLRKLLLTAQRAQLNFLSIGLERQRKRYEAARQIFPELGKAEFRTLLRLIEISEKHELALKSALASITPGPSLIYRRA
jgi:hypothetical protein